ncbi:hypothetical protein CERSUDRAFT_98234 [Gelatoporia subvermispora B]|uniref:N-acetyltransferase domain-containing protein n=1 Tax=Ceriporiopsis subvermispora (strain B) TaxID=914234 RepID=M2R689_CERS8|nr:hypothetical protein CERSUDRAFT_98234 [Gelatoporia subvermispora B]
MVSSEGFVRREKAFTVNGGDAIVYYERAPSDEDTRSLLTRLLDTVAGWVVFTLRYSDTHEQKKRRSEYAAKNRAALESIGKEVKDMLILASLATAPSKQRRGYGTALVREVTQIADAQGRDTILTSSNIANTAFYESCGFRMVRQYQLGDENPAWRHEPVVLHILVRPNTCAGAEDKGY